MKIMISVCCLLFSIIIFLLNIPIYKVNKQNFFFFKKFRFATGFGVYIFFGKILRIVINNNNRNILIEILFKYAYIFFL
jgi:hypothetical protein